MPDFVVVEEVAQSVTVQDAQFGVVVVQETSTVVVQEIGTQVIEVAAVGPQGIPGPQGPSGDLSYQHEQSAAAATWTITHGLGKYPSVTVVDSAGDECEGAVNYISVNQLVVSFSAAFAGRAFLN